MDKTVFTGKNSAELRSIRLGLEKELFNFRFQRVGQTLENPARIRTVRRDIARIKTQETLLAKESISKPTKPSSKKSVAASKAAQ